MTNPVSELTAAEAEYATLDAELTQVNDQLAALKARRMEVRQLADAAKWRAESLRSDADELRLLGPNVGILIELDLARQAEAEARASYDSAVASLVTVRNLSSERNRDGSLTPRAKQAEQAEPSAAAALVEAESALEVAVAAASDIDIRRGGLVRAARHREMVEREAAEAKAAADAMSRGRASRVRRLLLGASA